MYFGTNLQYLRKHNGNLTQEKLAERIGVSRQTISKWESGDAYPEIAKLLELSQLFSCSLDALVREDLTLVSTIYLPIQIRWVPGFQYASYTVVSKNPEDDSAACLHRWSRQCGLDALSPTAIGWDFPYLSQDQKHRFGLRGYVSALVLPKGFETDLPGADIIRQDAAAYAVMTIRDPFTAPFERIPRAYGLIMEYLSANGLKKHISGILPCFERVYTRDGVTCMDVCIHCQPPEKQEIHTYVL